MFISLKVKQMSNYTKHSKTNKMFRANYYKLYNVQKMQSEKHAIDSYAYYK